MPILVEKRQSMTDKERQGRTKGVVFNLLD